MGANTTNAIYFLITTLFDLYLGALLLRVLLQIVRADFYNPLSQLLWKVTNPIAMPLTKLLPRLPKLDIAGLVALLLVAIIYVILVGWMFSTGISAPATLYYAVLKCLVLTVNVYSFTLFVQAIISWIGSGVNNPAANVLFSLNEPLLRRVRRFIPPVSGLDLSPLVVILALQVVNRLIPLPFYFR